MRITDNLREVGALLAAGLTSEEVAQRLGISRAGVDSRRARLYLLLGLNGHPNANVLLAHYALWNGWTENKYKGPGRPRKAR